MDHILTAYCAVCQDPTPHDPVDAGSCVCQGCGEVELLVAPLALPA